jgi:hypothetical protein
MTRSPQELRHESERNRAELAVTIDRLRLQMSDAAEDIRHKLSSEHIKSEVSDYVSHRTQGWVEALKQRATENPMQAVAVGSAVAFPLLRLARGFPLPLLMIGAGLALTSKKVRYRAAQSAAPAVERAGDILDEAAERARVLSGNVKNVLSSAQSQANDIANDAQDATASLADNLWSRAARVTSAAGDRLTAGVVAARDTAAAVKDSATTAPAKAGQVIGDNAALIGGLGIAIGAIVAATLPETMAEAKAMGQTSDSVKQLATEAAQSGVKAGMDATMSAADAAATSVAEANLGGHASRMTQNLTDALKGGAGDSVRAALNTSQNSNT